MLPQTRQTCETLPVASVGCCIYILVMLEMLISYPMHANFAPIFQEFALDIEITTE